jgi:tetratricopeptide (TPR) repeat protein
MLNFILDAILSLQLPLGVQDSPKAKALFEQGKAKVRSYHGHPQALLEALSLFKQSSESYAYIGIAKVITAASYQSGDSYSHEGLGKAIGWLDRTKALPHDPLELALTEVSIRVCFQQYAKAHQLLDGILQHHPEHFAARASKLELYCCEEKTEQAEALFSHLLPEATDEQKKGLYQHLYFLYVKSGLTYKAKEILLEILYLEPDNPWMHHNISISYLQLGDLPNSRAHNAKALKLMEFPAALAVRQELKRITWRVRRQTWTRGTVALIVCFFALVCLARIASTPRTPIERSVTPEQAFIQHYSDNLMTCRIGIAKGDGSNCKKTEELLEECVVMLSADASICQSLAVSSSLLSEARETLLEGDKNSE